MSKRIDKAGALRWLARRGSKREARDMEARYGIRTRLRVFGVPMGTMQALAKQVHKTHDAAERHALAAALWESGVYEGQMLGALIDEPALVTRRQMEAWCAACDNWGVVDTVCFKLFDQVDPDLAFTMVRALSRRKGEFQKRAGFALLACLALHDRESGDERFAECLPLIERGAKDDRNFVKKAVNWALRAVGRRGRKLNGAAKRLATRLAASTDAAARWVGSDALRQL